jgi:hypothetical protein
MYRLDGTPSSFAHRYMKYDRIQLGMGEISEHVRVQAWPECTGNCVPAAPCALRVDDPRFQLIAVRSCYAPDKSYDFGLSISDNLAPHSEKH